MINYLKKLAGISLTDNEKNELEFLRKELAQLKTDQPSEKEGSELKDSKNEYKQENQNYKEQEEQDEVLPDEENEEASEHSSKEDEDFMGEEELQKMQKKKESKAGVKRAGVSAEAYGDFNKKENFIPRVIEKTQEQKDKIRSRILTSFLFKGLDDENLNIVLGAMDHKELKSGEAAITQGDDGNCLYVVESGQLDCTKHFTKDGEEKYLKTYQPGEAFGELALLYNAPRAATIKAKTDCQLWELDRETFNNIVKTAAQKKREKYVNILKNVEILKTIDPYEIMQICDAIQSSNYTKDDFIIKEGEIGDIFYILEEGEAVATKTLEKGKAPTEIKNYKSGEYFGERSLIKGEPRYCNIKVTSEAAKVLSLDRDSFKRLLGPIESLLKRNIEQYKKYLPNQD